jgi:hypothetical protein
VAHALTGDVAYPFGLCQANLVAVSTSNDQPAQGTIALSLAGAPATADECFNDAYTNSGAAVTTGDSASSSITAVAVNGCYTVGDYASVAGGGITQCGRAFLANVSVFNDASGSCDSLLNSLGLCPTGPGLVSVSLFGDASGSWLAVAPMGNASAGYFAPGCNSVAAPYYWQYCSSSLLDAIPGERQLIYSAMQTLASVGLAQTQAAINYYNTNVSALSTTVATGTPLTGCETHGGVLGTYVGPGAGIVQTDIWCSDGYHVVYAYVYTVSSTKRFIRCEVETIGTKLVMAETPSPPSEP